LLSTGDRAPGFRLQSRPGEQVDVGAWIGKEKVVVLFFPLAFSPVCAAEARAIAHDWSEWRDLGARVFGVSVDSPFVTERFREEQGLPFPVLSDFNRNVTRDYGVAYELHGLRDVPRRSAFVIAADGRIVYAWSTDDADELPDFEAIKAAARVA